MPPMVAAPATKKAAAVTTAKARSKSGPRTSVAKAAPAKAAPAKDATVTVAATNPLHKEPSPLEAAAITALVYSGTPLGIAEAEAVLRSVTPAQLNDLSESTAPEEQLPAQMMLEFVGDKDLTWGNAQKSLKEGAKCVSEILEMEGANYVTKRSLERLEGFGQLMPGILQQRSAAAFALAVYLEAVVDVAKEKLGMKVAPALPQPEPDEKPPEWPIIIDFKQLATALQDALKWRKTPLFICNGKASVVDTFFSYQSCSLIDAKWILNMVDIKKEFDVPQMREQIRLRLIAALKFGNPIHISMSSSAVTLGPKYCSETEFPKALFQQTEWLRRGNYGKIIRDEDLVDWPGTFPGRMKDDCASYAFVTSDMSRESACEFLPEVLPHFDSMAMIEIDPTTIN